MLREHVCKEVTEAYRRTRTSQLDRRLGCNGMLYARTSFLANTFKKSAKSVEISQAFPAVIQSKLSCGFEEGGDLWQQMAVDAWVVSRGTVPEIPLDGE